MNFLTKSISTHLFNSSQSSTKCNLFLQTLTVLHQSAFFSSKSRGPRVAKSQEPSSAASIDHQKPENESKIESLCKRPSKIPFNSNIANSVDLIGFVKCPVLVEALPDGSCVAKTVVFSTQDCTDLEGPVARPLGSLPPVLIPVVFEGDLAVVVKCYVKKDDCIQVSGQLSFAHLPSVTEKNQLIVHLLVQNMNFVGGLKRKDHVDNDVDARSKIKVAGLGNDDVVDKVSVKQKKSDKKVTILKKKAVNNGWKDWRDLIKKPNEWWDYREKKLNGTVKANHPDFKHKEKRVPLWLSNDPKWALPGLKGLEFSDSKVNGEKQLQVSVPKLKA